MAQQKAREEQQVREHVGQGLLRAGQREADRDWAAAVTELEKVREALDARPDLGADDLRAEVRERLRLARENQDERQRARQRLTDFQAPCNDALFFHARFTGLEAAQDRDRTRAAARKALAMARSTPVEKTGSMKA